MADLSCKYMGLSLTSPVIVGSCGLTHSADKIKQMEAFGAGAVVLKSVFEEQITHEIRHSVEHADFNAAYADALDYIKGYTEMHSFDQYARLIGESKKAVSIPVIASINCSSTGDWASYARRMEEAGADGLELNIFFLPSDFSRSGEDNESRYFRIVEHVKQFTRLPIAVKTSHYFSSLANFMQKLSYTGIDSLVLWVHCRDRAPYSARDGSLRHLLIFSKTCIYNFAVCVCAGCNTGLCCLCTSTAH